MIYIVTNSPKLFDGDYIYTKISVKESIEILSKMSVISLDTETSGLEVFTNTLLTTQLGNKDTQIYIDNTTVDIKEYKELLESDRLFIIHNAKFDLKWFYKEGIVIRNVYDTLLAEKILYLGYSSVEYPLGLKDVCKRWLNVELDKSIRGKINSGFSEEVLHYAINDIVYLETIKDLQTKLIEERGQIIALQVENEFVRVLAYIEFCGIKIDTTKWKAKMEKDNKNLKLAEETLNKWVIDYVINSNDKSMMDIDFGVRKFKKNSKKNDGVFVTQMVDSLFEEFNEGPQCVINWNSQNQVIPLFEKLGLDLWTKDKKTGELKKSVDSKLLKQQAHKSPLVPLYLEYSKYFKVVSSFGQNFLDAINSITGRIHPEFNQMMSTGRLSCGKGGKGKIEEEDNSINKIDKSVNIQQIPSDDETREAFIPESNYLLIDCDYGDLQMWIILS